MKKILCSLLTLLLIFSVSGYTHPVEADQINLITQITISVPLPQKNQESEPFGKDDVVCSNPFLLTNAAGWFATEGDMNNVDIYRGTFEEGWYLGFVVLKPQNAQDDYSSVVVNGCHVYSTNAIYDKSHNVTGIAVKFAYFVRPDGLTNRYFRVIDSESGQPVSGASLQLLDHRGRILRSWTSTSDYYLVEGLNYGDYRVLITSPASGYTTGEILNISIGDPPYPPVLKPYPTKFNIYVNRTAVNISCMESGTPVNNIQYVILDSRNNSFATVTSSQTNIITGLNVNENYTIKVTNSGEYLMPANQTFMLDSQGAIRSYSGTVSGGKLVVPLERPAVSLAFQDYSGNQLNSIRYTILDSLGNRVGDFTSSDNNRITGLKVNSNYTIIVTNGNGYMIPLNEVFSVNQNGRVSYSGDIDSAGRLLVQLAKGEINVSFTSNGSRANPVKFNVLDQANNIVGSYVSDPVAKVSGLSPNVRYTIHVTEANGYYMPADQTFTLDYDGTISTSSTTNNDVVLIDLNQVTSKLIFMYQNKGVKSIKYSLLNSSNKVVGTYTSNTENLLTGINVNEKYTIRIDEADGYFIPDKQTFTINSDGSLTYSGKLDKNGRMVVNMKKILAQLVFMSNGQEVNDIAFNILNSSGDIVKKIDADDSKTIEGLKLDTEYTIHVTDSGYYNVPADQKFTINKNGKLTYSADIDSRGRMVIELQADYEYKFSEGAFASWTKGSKKVLRFAVKRTVADQLTSELFDYITVDNKIIDRSNYEVKANPFRISLSDSYLETLEPGEHKLAVYFRQVNGNKSDKISTTFTVASPATIPNDAISSYNTMSINVPLVLVALMAFSFVISRKLWSR